MPAFTVRYRPSPSGDIRMPLEDFARREGAQLSWQHANANDRTYALVEGTSREKLGTTPLGAGSGATVFDTPVIALAIRPNVAEALPAIEQALAGPGRPAGVLGVEREDDRLIIEWNLDVTPAHVMLGLVDVELARFHAARVTELLTPLPLDWWTAIARSGLQAPEIAPERVLEALIEEHDVVS